MQPIEQLNLLDSTPPPGFTKWNAWALTIVVNSSALPLQAYTSKHGVDDMVMLTSISNDAINDNLKKRFAADLIYVRSSFFSLT
jgi:myosin heavy subunit